MTASYIFTAILALCFGFACYNSFAKCIHMLQLSSYQYAGYFRTVFRIRSYFIPYFFICVFCAPLIAFAGSKNVCAAIMSVLFLLWGAVRKPSKYAKKKLVYTKRVKRLIFTCLCIEAVCAGLMFAFISSGRLSLIIPLCVYALSAFAVLLANIINTPIEKAVNSYYINDAKRILKDSEVTTIGITGSYGKTSVKFYLAAILKEKFDTLATPSSFNTPLGVVRTVRESMKPQNEVFVCEMGARHVGDIKELCNIAKPDMGIITSIGEQHLETFHTLENIKKTKLELADAVEAKAHGKIFINADSVSGAANLPYTNIITYGTSKSCDYTATDVTFSENGMSFTVSGGGETAQFTTKLLGEHNILNLLGAIVVAHEMGIEFSKLVMRVKRIKPVAHRQELRRMANGIIIDDAFNANPAGAKSALKTLSGFDGCKILITPGMVELGSKEYELNCEFGKQAAVVCDYVFLVGKLHTQSIYDGLCAGGFSQGKITVSPTFKDAMAKACAMHVNGKRIILIENDLPDNY